MTYREGSGEVLWRGVVVSESLRDPTVLNGFSCRKFLITPDTLPLDEPGQVGRWHLYWLETEEVPWDVLEANMKPSWYGHFWKGRELRVIFSGKVFVMDTVDKATWAEAATYGLAQGIPPEQLDFSFD